MSKTFPERRQINIVNSIQLEENTKYKAFHDFTTKKKLKLNNECGYFEVDLKTFNHSKISIIEEVLKFSNVVYGWLLPEGYELYIIDL